MTPIEEKKLIDLIATGTKQTNQIAAIVVNLDTRLKAAEEQIVRLKSEVLGLQMRARENAKTH